MRDFEQSAPDLPRASEITKGEYWYFESKKGPSIIYFEDFVIGPENVTFYDEITGGLGSTLQNDITALSAKVDYFETLLGDLSGLPDELTGVRSDLTSIENTVINFVNSISSASINAEDLSTATNSQVGFWVVNNEQWPSGRRNEFFFTEYKKRGTKLTDGTDISLDDGKSFFFRAPAAFTMLFECNLAINFPQRIIGSAFSGQLALFVNEREVHTTIIPHVNTGIQTVQFTTAISLVAGDIVRLGLHTRGIPQGGSTYFRGTRIA